MKELLTPKQVAVAIGVSEASLKRWCDKGLLPMTRTAGGHRRLAINGVVQFLRESGHDLVRPEVLGLPATIGKGATVVSRGREQLREALEAGQEDQVRRIVFDLYLAGHPVQSIGDQVVAGAFHDIGERWSHGEVEVYEERRGCEVMVRVLNQLRLMLPTPAANAPIAIGGGVDSDPYLIPNTLVELVLREAGWQSQFYGIGLPIETLCTAIEQERPKLFWISVSWLACETAFIEALQRLYDTALTFESALVVGGQAFSKNFRGRLKYSAYCDNLQHLLSFAETLYKRPV